jgi:hypothetical protein
MKRRRRTFPKIGPNTRPDFGDPLMMRVETEELVDLEYNLPVLLVVKNL